MMGVHLINHKRSNLIYLNDLQEGTSLLAGIDKSCIQYSSHQHKNDGGTTTSQMAAN